MSASLSLLFLGATTTISLVAAIGAQGTFVLRQGILGRHITPIIIFCILSDALMIGLGVVGLGALLDAAPWFIEVFRYVGAAFLAWFGFEAGRRVFTPHSIVVDDAEGDSQSLKAVSADHGSGDVFESAGVVGYDYSFGFAGERPGRSAVGGTTWAAAAVA